MKITNEKAKELANKLGLKVHEGEGYKEGIPINEWRKGIEIELEHGTRFGHLTNVTNDDLLLTAKIALAHLIEFPDYYKYLIKMEEDREKYWKLHGKPCILSNCNSKTLASLYGSGITWVSGSRQTKYKSEIQSVLIPKDKFKSKKDAMKWIKRHKQFEIKKIDETKNMYRFRQKRPSLYEEFRTIELDPKLGIKAVLGLKRQ